MPVWTFLEEYDLSGKTIIPFFSHNGSSNGANSVDRVAELAEGANVLTEDALSLRGSSVSDSEREVKDWAATLSASVLAGCGNSSNDNNNSNNNRNDSGSSTDAPVQPETQETETETSGAAREAVSGESIVTNGGEEIALASLEHRDETAGSVVYYTSDISPQAMVDIYAAFGEELKGDNIAVKLSTGEPPASNYLDPNLIADLVHQVDGTIVENNTAYGGQRAGTAMHYQVAKDHGFTEIADFVVLDEDGSVSLPVEGGTRLTENLVGAHFPEYDGYLVLSHFKGHAMAGFGGAIKNISIGLGSQEGKCLIHTAGESRTSP